MNGIISKCYFFLHRIKVSLVWNSQKRRLLCVGKGCIMEDIPYIIGYEYISIGDHFSGGKDVRLEAWSKYEDQSFDPQIIIGNNVTFTDRCYLSCIDKIVIGNDVLFGRDVFVSDNSHGDTTIEMLKAPPQKRKLTSKGPVVIKDNVWVGRQVTILSGVTIGENSIIGANSVVIEDVPDNCVAVGSPARIVKRI